MSQYFVRKHLNLQKTPKYIFSLPIIYFSFTYTTESITVFTGTHNKGMRGQNWNMDPFNVSTKFITDVQVLQPGTSDEYCLVFTSSSHDFVKWQPCTGSDPKAVMCFTSATTYCPLEQEENETPNERPQNVTSSELETYVMTAMSPNTTSTVVQHNVTPNIKHKNGSPIEEMIHEMTINPKETCGK